jgi:nucleotide-binding universal stress UspA family protein
MRLTAVHAVDPFQYRFGPQESSNLRRQQAWASAQESMARWLQAGKFCDASATVIEGEAAPAIAEFVTSNGADLIVVGTSGRRHANRLLLGSVAEEIFREIKCPVVVLGPKTRPRKRRAVPRFVFATDLEPHSLAALSQLSKLCTRFHSDVAVVRAVPLHTECAGERNRLRKEARERFEAAADQNLKRHTRKISVVFAPPVKAIPVFANRFGADAIVMGIRSGGELSRATTHIPWTLAHRVITEAKCPVITIRG